MKIKLMALLFAAAAALPGICQTNFLANNQPEEQPVKGKNKTKITGSVEMNYLRHYLWRGAVFGNNDVAQPVLELSHKGFTISLSPNLNYLPKNLPKDLYTKNVFFDEQDVELRYETSFGKLSTQFSAMAYFYFYQPLSPNTAELYNWTGYNFYKGFSFFTENSLDFAKYSGAIYSNNGILFEHTAKKDIQIEWTLYAGTGNSKFNSTYFGTNKAGINLVGTHIDITKNFGKYFVKLMAEKNQYTMSAIKQSTELKGTDNFGIAAGIKF